VTRIQARILLDSITGSPTVPRLTTWLLTIPRYLLAELNTHRAFSRNCPSSRAIPVHKRMKMVVHDPASPAAWGLDKPGMQAGADATGFRLKMAKATWRLSSLVAVVFAGIMLRLGIAKQVSNRILEPYVWVTDLVTTTQEGLENFLALRADGSADPGMQALAYEMIREFNDSVPQVLLPGEWHIPFGSRMPPGLTWDEQIKVAVARCARVSFDSFDGVNDVNKDFALHDRLAEQGHWSSFEHIAQVPPATFGRILEPNEGGNLGFGWIQLRKTYPGERRADGRVSSLKPWSYAVEVHAKTAIAGALALGCTRAAVVYHFNTLNDDKYRGLTLVCTTPQGSSWSRCQFWEEGSYTSDARMLLEQDLIASLCSYIGGDV